MPRVVPKNLEKVFWPDDGLTKGDLVSYLDAVAPAMLPFLKDRPLTVKRYPDGIFGISFFQKNTPAHAPTWVPRRRLWAGSAGRDVEYALCNSKDVLLWFADQGAIEFHPWLSRTDRLDRPDFLTFDLDPPEGGLERAVEAAVELRSVLDELGLAGIPKTSGAKGVHVFVPLRRGQGYEAVRAAAAAVAERLERRLPEVVTTEFRKAKRGGKVLVDIGRNAPGAHIVAPYSPRARPGGPVSFPVPWEDLPGVRPERYTIRTVPELLEREGDPWKQLMPPPQRIPRAVLEHDERTEE